MRSYYQVSAVYTFSQGRHSLSSLSFYTDSKFKRPDYQLSKKAFITYRTFRTYERARGYIDYLISQHPRSQVSRPVLVNHQLSLF